MPDKTLVTIVSVTKSIHGNDWLTGSSIRSSNAGPLKKLRTTFRCLRPRVRSTPKPKIHAIVLQATKYSSKFIRWPRQPTSFHFPMPSVRPTKLIPEDQSQRSPSMPPLVTLCITTNHFIPSLTRGEDIDTRPNPASRLHTKAPLCHYTRGGTHAYSFLECCIIEQDGTTQPHLTHRHRHGGYQHGFCNHAVM
jgi:hypothetical protein